MFSQWTDFISLLFPQVCCNCEKPLTSKEDYLCLSCELDLPRSMSLSFQDSLLKKFSFISNVTHAFSYLYYYEGGVSQKLVHSVKYCGKKRLGRWLGIKFGTIIKEEMDLAVDLIIPVPIHHKRQKQRGYNQSEIISQGISEVLNVKLSSDSIYRKINTKSQTKKSWLLRWETMEKVFEVNRPDMLQNQNVMLFDDVITTGATIGLLAEEVSKCNPKSIILASLATSK